MTLCFCACRLDFRTFLCQNHNEKGDDMMQIARTTIRISKDALKQLKSIAALEETTLSALLSALAEKFVEDYHNTREFSEDVIQRAKEIRGEEKES